MTLLKWPCGLTAVTPIGELPDLSVGLPDALQAAWKTWRAAAELGLSL